MPRATSVSITAGSHSSPPTRRMGKISAPAARSAPASAPSPQKTHSGCWRALCARRDSSRPARSRARTMRTGERAASPGRRQVSSGSSSSDRAPADENGVGARAHQMTGGARRRAGRPGRLARAAARHAAVGIERQLRRDQRAPLRNAQDVPGGEPMRGLDQQSALHRDARLAQGAPARGRRRADRDPRWRTRRVPARRRRWRRRTAPSRHGASTARASRTWWRRGRARRRARWPRSRRAGALPAPSSRGR